MISSVEGSTIITRSYSTQHALLPTKPSKSSTPALPTTPLQEAHNGEIREENQLLLIP